MATCDTPISLPPRPVAQARTRAWPALGLAAAVLGGHAWLVALLAPEAPHAGPARPGLVQLRSLPAVVPAVLPTQFPAAAALAPAPAVAPSPPPKPARPAARQPRPADTAPPAAGPVPAPAAAWPDAVALADALPPGASAEGEAPPLYPVRLPPPAQLRYALRYNGRAGEALLVWQHDGTRYRLTLDGAGGDDQPLLAQASEGGLDAHGLAPERFLDRRRAGRQQAANFRRDIGRIGYSGPAHQHPAWPGAQDRLSWLAQLVAVLAAADAAPTDLRFFVADAQGHAGLWQLQRQVDAPGPTPWGDQVLQHWQREPPRPEGLRIDVWLAAQPATPAGAWPVRLRFAVPRSGDAFELNLLATP